MTALLRKQAKLVMSGTIMTQRIWTYLSSTFEPSFIRPGDKVMEKIVLGLMTRGGLGKRSGAWHPSGIHRCPREQTFVYLGVPKKTRPNPGLQMVFDDGHYRHIRWQITLLYAGLIDEVETTTKLKADNVVGHLDGLKKKAYTFELKGIHGMQYKSILDEPKPEHLEQVELGMMATDLDTAVLIYEDKGSPGTFQEHDVHADMKRRLKLQQRLDGLNAGIANRSLPPILPDCKSRKGPEFRDCEYAYICLRCDYSAAEAASKEPDHEAALKVVADARPVRLRKKP